MLNHPTIKPCVVFLTGLSGAGKTTIAQELAHLLKQKAIQPVVLDGDEIRNAIQLTDFDEAARKKHNRSVGALAALLEAQEHIVIVALIAPYADIRDEIRMLCNRFIEVYVATDISVCIERDPKGLYKKAIAGEIKNLTGISAPYHAPQNPELVIDTAVMPAEKCALKIFALISAE